MFLVVILIIFLICFLGFIISAAIAGTRKKAKGGESGYGELEAAFLREEGFPEGFSTSRWDTSGALPFIGVALDEKNRLVACSTGRSSILSFRWSDIVSVDLLTDGWDSQNIKLSAGRALAGRAIAGRTGAIIGALSGGTENSRVCTSIRIHILLRNNAFTSYDLYFLNETVEESSCAFQTRYAAAQRAMDLLRLAKSH